jgi:ribosomal protein S1
MNDNYEVCGVPPFSVGDVVVGKVVMWRPFGVFVEFENGARGVIDIMNIDPDDGSVDWSTVPKVGESVKSVVLEVENDFSYLLTLKRKFWSLKEEWENYVSQLEIGAVVTGAVDQNGRWRIFVNFGRGRGKLIESDVVQGDYTSVGRTLNCRIVGVDSRFMHVLLKQV